MSSRPRQLRSRPRSRGLARASSRGLTLLEIVLALTLLALLSATVLGSLSAIDAMQRRNQMVLAANEVASRLMLMQLDDDRSLPSKAQVIEQGPFLFMYDLVEETVKLELNRRQGSLDTKPQGLDRFQQYSITIYEAELINGMPRSVEQVAQLQRIVDPFTMRNRESMRRIEQDPNRFIGRVTQFFGKGAGGGSGPANPPRPTNR
jgi:type II secretory pathway pseudopilin PulG